MHVRLLSAMVGACLVVAVPSGAPGAGYSITPQEAFARRYQQAWPQTAAYRWRSWTEAVANGEMRWVELHQVGFGPRGELERSPIDRQRTRAGSGAHPQAKPIDRELHALVDQVLRLVSACLDPTAMQAFAGRATLRSGPLERSGSQTLVGEGPDPAAQVELLVDGDSTVPLRMDLHGSWEGAPLAVGIEFAQLRDGTTHIARITARTAPSGTDGEAQTLSVVIVHSRFTRTR